MKHYSVLLKECLEGLDIQTNGIYVDGTLGRAGHSSEILKLLDKEGFLYCFDQDEQAVIESEPKLAKISDNFKIIHANFAKMQSELAKHNVTGVDGILLDLGVSSPQLDDLERGFSYHGCADLDMRMDKSSNLSAYNVVNEYSEEQLAKVIFHYGDEQFSRKIAREIVAARTNAPIKTTEELVEIIKKGIPTKFHFKGKHPARKTFQAIRIEVNAELEVLKNVLNQALDLLNPNGRLVIITFHSLEDKIVKKFFKDITEIKKDFVSPLPDVDNTKFELITKKPILPTEEELLENKRSRSAKLRIIRRR